MTATSRTEQPPRTAPQTEAPRPGRDPLGRFCKGNKFGPGNPHARQTAGLRSAFLEVLTPDDIRELARQLLAQAKAGDLGAAKVVLAYGIGRPAEAVNPDTLDRDEMRLYRQEVIPVEAFTAMKADIPINGLLALWRILQPCLAAQFLRVMGDAVVHKKMPDPDEWDLDPEDVFETPAADEPAPPPPPTPAPECHPEPEVAAPPHPPAARPRPAGAAAAPRPTATPQAHESEAHATPSPNGRDGARPPSANGWNGHAPSANGVNGEQQLLERLLALFRAANGRT